MHGICKGKKKTTQKIPLTKIFLTSANGRQNNKKIALMGVVIKGKRELWGIKKNI
jgi:hypothetical protein